MALSLNLTSEEAYLLLVPTKRAVFNDEFMDLSPTTILVEEMARRPINKTEFLNANASTKNSSNLSEAGYVEQRDESLARIEIAVLATILYLALFGNGVVLLVLRLRRQKLTRMHWFIAHLAIADLFVAIFNILPQLIWDVTVVFYGNDFLCRTVMYFQVVAMYASSYALVMAAIDRYLSICHPLTSQTLSPKRVHLMIAFAWSLSLLFAMPQLFIFSLQKDGPGEYSCYGDFNPDWGLQAYISYIFITDYALPFLILAFCYGRICHVVWASVGSKESTVYTSTRNGTSESSTKAFKLRISFRRMRDHSNSSSVDRANPSPLMVSSPESKKFRGHQRGVSKSKMKTVKLTLTVVLCYLFCWAPFFFVQMWMAFNGDIFLEHPVIVIIMLLASLNSCTNPWIYMAFSGRPCPRGTSKARRFSRSWGHSTHVSSLAEAPESRSRSSLIDLSHTRLTGRSSSPRFIEKRGHLNSKC